MGRKPRFNLIGIPQHVIQRGHNRQSCFFSTDDYKFYLASLRLAAEKYHCDIHAYVLMNNHVHLLITPTADDAIPQLMQSLGRRYVRYINKTYQRSGTLWEGRYKACLVDSDNYLFSCMRYIEMNPVRAAMVSQPGEYQWSSYQANAGIDKQVIITPHPLYASLGIDHKTRASRYRDYFIQEANAGSLVAIREALNLELVLGSNQFRSYVETRVARPTRLGHAGRPRLKEESGCYIYIRNNCSLTPINRF